MFSRKRVEYRVGYVGDGKAEKSWKLFHSWAERHTGRGGGTRGRSQDNGEGCPACAETSGTAVCRSRVTEET